MYIYVCKIKQKKLYIHTYIPTNLVVDLLRILTLQYVVCIIFAIIFHIGSILVGHFVECDGEEQGSSKRGLKLLVRLAVYGVLHVT